MTDPGSMRKVYKPMGVNPFLNQKGQWMASVLEKTDRSQREKYYELMAHLLAQDYVWRVNEEEVLRYLFFHNWDISYLKEVFAEKNKYFKDLDRANLNEKTLKKELKSGISVVQGTDKDGRGL